MGRMFRCACNQERCVSRLQAEPWEGRVWVWLRGEWLDLSVLLSPEEAEALAEELRAYAAKARGATV